MWEVPETKYGKSNEERKLPADRFPSALFHIRQTSLVIPKIWITNSASSTRVQVNRLFIEPLASFWHILRDLFLINTKSVLDLVFFNNALRHSTGCTETEKRIRIEPSLFIDRTQNWTSFISYLLPTTLLITLIPALNRTLAIYEHFNWHSSLSSSLTFSSRAA